MRELPVHHISIRVPWHDAGWNGTVCQDPVANVECTRLRNIREKKDDDAQSLVAGRRWNQLADDQLPPCVRERAGFMAPFEVKKVVEHPYVEGGSKAHSHFAPTTLRLPPYSAPALPFRWVLVKEAPQIADRCGVHLDMALEERAERLMGFSSNWLQAKQNQSEMFETFFSAIQPTTSLCFFYAKQVPLAEDPRRVLIGAGRVADKGRATEYRYSGDGELESLLWERPVMHTIRPDFRDGFLLPYQAIHERAREEVDFDPLPLVAFAPRDHWDEFSYASELVSHDAAIAALLACATALRATQGVIPGDWSGPLQWADDRLNELWQLRGPHPGLGSALSAAAVPNGALIAYELSKQLGDNEDPWPLVDHIMGDPTKLPPDLAAPLGPTWRKIWSRMPSERRSLLELLSRFALTPDQAKRFFITDERKAARIDASDADLLRNPYLLFEADRYSEDPIPVTVVDRGVFPDPVIRQKHPLPEPSAVVEPFDPRRTRALVAHVLEVASEKGDTLWPADRSARSVRELDLQPPCEVSTDILSIIEEDFDPTIACVEMADGTRAYQLDRLANAGELIRSTIEKRLTAARLEVTEDWDSLLATNLGPVSATDEEEARARQEKVASLQELAASRFSVLVGPAGTGKTTLLSVLVQQPEVKAGHVLLLAPTGKARVQLERHTGLPAQTIAQFLLKRGRYDYKTDSYRLSSDAPRSREAKTVIIDEASMVTEEQLAATLDALQGIDRLILVGDFRQLPPIGSGRPFVDTVKRVRGDEAYTAFPRVHSGYCELTIRRRQIGKERDDLVLAEWFSGEKPGAGADEIWSRLATGDTDESVRVVSWSDDSDLKEKLVSLLVDELELNSTDDETGFECSVGGSEFKGWVYFHHQWQARPGAGEKAEAWQILSPVRNELHGTDGLNREIQRRFRSRTKLMATPENWWQRKTPEPVGPQGILYGDKVINLRNGLYKVVFAEGDKGYVANGEIGVVVGEFKGRNWKLKRLPKNVEVEYATQLGNKFVYWPWGDEGDPPLELAYALTVHKAQGSEFDLTILVIPEPVRLLSRELLYTALTRQRNRVVIMYQGEIGQMRRYSDAIWSETAARMTNLFYPPDPRLVRERFLEDRLIHMTRRGELVRSKSEVIIADLLYSLGADYTYEQDLETAGRDRLPDFTLSDDDTGRTIFWEHLGMLHDPRYRRKWEEKKGEYLASGIVPFDDQATGPRVLVETRDNERGAISSQELEEVARRGLAWLTG